MLKVTGLDELQHRLNDMGRRAESFSGNHSVPVPELLTPDFLRRCSRFQSAEEMFEASGFKIESAEDFTAIPDAAWDEFVRANTSFVSWEAMLGEAGGEWAARRLEF
jgi:hypothetical protein